MSNNYLTCSLSFQSCLRDLIKEGILLALPKVRSMVEDSVTKSMICPDPVNQMASLPNASMAMVDELKDALGPALASEFQRFSALQRDGLVSTLKSEIALRVAESMATIITNVSAPCNSAMDSDNPVPTTLSSNATLSALAMIREDIRVLTERLVAQTNWASHLSKLEAKIDRLGSHEAKPQEIEAETSHCLPCPDRGLSLDFDDLKSELLDTVKVGCPIVNYTLITTQCYDAARSALKDSNLEGVCAPCEAFDYGKSQKYIDSLGSKLVAELKCPDPVPCPLANCPQPKPVDYTFIATTCLDVSQGVLNRTLLQEICPPCQKCEHLNYDRIESTCRSITDSLLSKANLEKVCPACAAIPECPSPICPAITCPEMPPCPNVVCTANAKPVVMGEEAFDFWNELVHGQYAPYVIFVQLGLILMLSLILLVVW